MSTRSAARCSRRCGRPDQPGSVCFKASDDSFAILTQSEGIAPAPYLARAKWVMLDRMDRLKLEELEAYLVRSHALVAAKLTKKERAALGL